MADVEEGVPIDAAKPITTDTSKSTEAHNDKGHKPVKKEAELDSKLIMVKVYSPYQTFFDGPATSLSAENDTGPFDILPKHHNFMTLVNAGEIIIRAENAEEKKLRITRGVLHVRRNKVTLFLDV